jgi:mRNA-degrading endonuclease YafQ of YafQ-DinJ toxin-antitoxin module
MFKNNYELLLKSSIKSNNFSITKSQINEQSNILNLINLLKEKNPNYPKHKKHNIDDWKNRKEYQFKAILYKQTLIFNLFGFDLEHATELAIEHIRKLFKSNNIIVRIIE